MSTAGNKLLAGVRKLIAAAFLILAAVVPASAEAAPPPVTNLRVTGVTQTTISIAFNGQNVRYLMYRNGAQVATVPTQSYTFTGLTCGTSYVLGVRAQNTSNQLGPLRTITQSTMACGPPPPPPNPQCSDGVDNADPEDSLVDLADPGCASASDNDETDPPPPPPSPQCSDGVDNADPEDALVDLADPGCASASDNDETDPPPPPPPPPPGEVFATGFEGGSLAQWNAGADVSNPSNSGDCTAAVEIPSFGAHTGTRAYRQTIRNSGGCRLARYADARQQETSDYANTYRYTWYRYLATATMPRRDHWNTWQTKSKVRTVAGGDGVARPFLEIELGTRTGVTGAVGDPLYPFITWKGGAQAGMAQSYPGPYADSGSTDIYGRTYLQDSSTPEWSGNLVSHPVGEWVKYEVEMKSSREFTGTFTLWVNDVLVFSFENIRTSDPHPQSITSWGPVNYAPGMLAPATLWLDGVSVRRLD